MKYIVILFVFFGFAQASPAQSVKTAFGTVQRFEHFHSEFVQPRHVDVWLPDGYDVSKQYAVLYMHDGQMLFDSSINWNHQEWGVDETMGKLMAEKKIQDCIVVGIWNTGTSRHSEYFPQKPFESLSFEERKMVQDALKNALKPQTEAFEPQSDLYLKFLVTELKPFIDTHFSTYRNRRSTFIAGSSMGGLISLYAVCEYPKVFGGAACLSTHWPGILTQQFNPIPDAFLTYLDKHLPNPKTHRIYFDYGDKTLDSLYKPTQLRVDALMKKKGFTTNWTTRSFPGHNHSEKAWASRLNVPIQFLLTRRQ
jgi:enterochelin esterase-like enzyme